MSPYCGKKEWNSFNIPFDWFTPVPFRGELQKFIIGKGLKNKSSKKIKMSSREVQNNVEEDLFIDSIKRAKKQLEQLKKKSTKKSLNLVKADAIHIQAHPSKEDINELIEDINKAQRSIKGGTLFRIIDKDGDPKWSFKDDGRSVVVTQKIGKKQDSITYDNVTDKIYKLQAQAIIEGSQDMLERLYPTKDLDPSSKEYKETKDLQRELREMYQQDKPKGPRELGIAREIAIRQGGNSTIGDVKDKVLIMRQLLRPHGLDIPYTATELKKIKTEVTPEEYRQIVVRNLDFTKRVKELTTTPEFKERLDSLLLAKITREDEEGEYVTEKAKEAEHYKKEEERISALRKIEDAQKSALDELVRHEAKSKKKGKKGKKKKALALEGGAEELPEEELSEEEADISRLAKAEESEETKALKGKKDKSKINDYEISQSIKSIHDSKGLSLGKAFEEALLLPKYESILKNSFKDSSDIHLTSSMDKLKGILLSTGMPLEEACIYDMYSNNNVFEVKNFDSMTLSDIKKQGGIYINKAKIYGTDLYRPEFYMDGDEVKLNNVFTTVHTPSGVKEFNLFDKSGKTLSIIYKLSDGVYRYDLSDNKDFDLVPLLDSSGKQVRRNGKKILVYDLVQPRVPSGTFLGKECFILNPLYLHKI